MGRFNKKGSSAIFLTMILVSMIGAAMVFLYAAKTAADSSAADGIMRLSARSVLGEYDRRLKKEYGILAYCGLEGAVEDRLKYYFDKNLSEMSLEGVNCDASAYSLSNTEVFEAAVVEAQKYATLSQLSDKLSGFLESEGLEEEWKEATTEAGEVEAGAKGGEEEHPERTLRNEAEKKSLPSNGIHRFGINTSLLEEEGFGIIENGTDTWYTNEYIVSNFRCAFGNEVERETFFKNEAEYILFGKYSDEGNRKAFRNVFVGLRTALNSAHIYADSGKCEETLAMAELLTPGPEAVATQAVLIAAWGAAEAYNDWSLLKEGQNVDFFKSELTWAVDLESAIENIGMEGAIRPSSDAGKDYKDYLRLFLYIMDEDTKLLRMMDLIQLNMRAAYYSDFLIAEHIVGFSFSANVNGREFKYMQNY